MIQVGRRTQGPICCLQQLLDPLWSAKEMRRIDELCQNPQRMKKIDDPAWAHLAIATAARKVSGIHALKIIRDNICTCFINVNKHAPTPLGIFFFLSPRSNTPQIEFDLDGSPGRRKVSEPHRPTAGKFNVQSSQSYPVKYHFNRQGGIKSTNICWQCRTFLTIYKLSEGYRWSEWLSEWDDTNPHEASGLLLLKLNKGNKGKKMHRLFEML